MKGYSMVKLNYEAIRSIYIEVLTNGGEIKIIDDIVELNIKHGPWAGLWSYNGEAWKCISISMSTME